MNEHIREIVGKTIKGVVVKESARSSPSRQIFLIFNDGCYFESYSSQGEMTWNKGLDRGGLPEVRRYLADVCQIVLEECEVRSST